MEEHRYIDRLSRRNRLGRFVWSIACALAFRTTPRWSMHRWRCGVLRLFGARIGLACRVDPSVEIWAPWNLVLGDYVAIAGNVKLYNVDRVHIGSKVAISQRSFVCTASHDISSLARPLSHSPISIGDHVWIAAEAMIFPGVTVNAGAVVAARAVLRNDAEAWTVWAGNPATRVGDRILTD